MSMNQWDDTNNDNRFGIGDVAFIVDDIIDGKHIEHDLELTGSSIGTISRIIGSTYRTLLCLNWEIEQRRRQLLNLEKRIFALEEQTPLKRKSKY